MPSRLLRIFAILFFALQATGASPRRTEILIYGATPGGIMAAVAAAREGQKVCLLEPSYIVGGMMSGGLTKTDIGNRGTVGGLSLEFYKRVADYYETTYGRDSAQSRDCHGGLFFEPHVADLVFSRMLSEQGVEVLRKHRLTEARVANGRIVEVTIADLEKGEENAYRADVFVDATYEGDLLAAAHVPYRIGREARAEYGESLAGMTEGPVEYRGLGDHRVQSYNIRSTLTNREDLRLPVPKPAHYMPEPHRHFVDYVRKHDIRTFEDLFRDWVLWGGINGKFDPNKADYVGANYAYAEADAEGRIQIVNRVRDYWTSLWWMLQNDPDLPDDFKVSARRWGLPKDEFTESGHITPQLYVREARRMLGRYLLTQSDLEFSRHKPDTVCLGSYNIDSHDVQALLAPEGLKLEGYLISGVDPWEIPYRSLTPYAPGNLLVVCAVSATHIAYGSLRMEPVFMMLGQATGLAAELSRKTGVPVQDVSVPALQEKLRKAGIPLQAQSRPVAEISALNGPIRVGERVRFGVRVEDARPPLRYAWNFDGSGEVQSTEAEPAFAFPAEKAWEVSVKVVDADGVPSLVAQRAVTVGDGVARDVSATLKDALLEGRWDRGSANAVQNRRRVNYHDMNEGKGRKSALFKATLLQAGRYRVAFAFQGGEGRATNVPVVVRHGGTETRIVVNQRTGAAPFAFMPLGEFVFAKGEEASVTVGNEGTDGYVSIDEIRWIWLGP